MSLAELHARVAAAEREVEARREQTAAQCRRTLATWRTGWTPGRLVVAGLALGFLSGRARPLRLVGSDGVLNLLRALAKLLERAVPGRSELADPNADAPNPAASTPTPDDPPAVWPDAPRRSSSPFVTTS